MARFNYFIGKEICEALGLKNVIDLDISVHLNEIASVTVKYYPSEDDLKKVIPVLQKHYLVPVGEALPVDITVIGNKYRNYQPVPKPIHA